MKKTSKITRPAAQHSTAQHSTAQHSTAQHSTAQHSTAQHSTAQHSTAQHSTAQHSTAQHSTAQHSTAQHSTAQHSTAQHSTAQHSTAQHSTAQHSTAQHSTAHCNTGLKNHKNYLFGLFISVSILIFYGCPSPEIILSGENTLTAITVNDGAKDMVGNIAANNITFSDSAVAGTTQVTVKAIQFSEKASADVNRNDTIPIKKTLAITAENGSIKYYAMSINVSTATTTGDGMTMTGTGMTMTGTPMTTTGNPAGTITGVQLAIDSITGSQVTFSGNFTKLNNPFITEMGILVTTNAMLNLELNNDKSAPMGATKYPAGAALLQRINNPVNTDITFSITVTNLQSSTLHYFRGYVIIGENVLYANTLNATTLTRKVSVSDFHTSFPYNVAGMNSDGYFRINYNKDPSPIRSFGVLITSGNVTTLELNGENAPAGARLIRGNATAIAAATSANGTLTLSAASLALETAYTFRYYVRNDAGITYTPIASKTTPGTTTLIPDDNFRNAIVSCINNNGTIITYTGSIKYTPSGPEIIGCTESFEGMITSGNSNRIKTAALVAITQFNYGNFIHPNVGGNGINKRDWQKIRSLSGVEQMVNLTLLNLDNNFLSNLDMTANTALTSLDVGSNSLTSLDVSANTALTSLDVGSNSLTSLNLATNTALTHLNVRDNSLTSIDVSQNTALTTLSADDNSLSSLNLATNTALTTLSADDNSLSSLNLTTNTALTSLTVHDNSLTSIDISANTALTKLDVTNNSLTSLDISANTALTESLFIVYNNPLLSCIRADASQLAGGDNAFNFTQRDGAHTLMVSCP